MVTLNWKYLTVVATVGRTAAGVRAGSHQHWERQRFGPKCMYFYGISAVTHGGKVHVHSAFALNSALVNSDGLQYAKKRLLDCLKAIFFNFPKQKIQQSCPLYTVFNSVATILVTPWRTSRRDAGQSCSLTVRLLHCIDTTKTIKRQSSWSYFQAYCDLRTRTCTAEQ